MDNLGSFIISDGWMEDVGLAGKLDGQENSAMAAIHLDPAKAPRLREAPMTSV
jgi:hypothetical protein